MDMFMWAALFAVGGSALAYDLWSHRHGGVLSVRESTYWSIFYVVLAVAFGGLIGLVMGSEDMIRYYTGYTLEKVLSLDNVMVFGVIFAYFAVPKEHQHWILHWGILGAVVLRLLFAIVGVEMLEFAGPWMLMLFGLIVLWSVWKIVQELRGAEDDEVDYENEWYIKATKKILGKRVTSETRGHALFINGAATPFFFALVAIEISDVMFALDSVPAIIAVTQDTFIVFACMIFAILGLRALFFLLSALIDALHLLQYALLAVLVWIAVKMFGQAFEAWGFAFGFHIDPIVSLCVVLGLLGTGVVASFVVPQRD